MIDGSHVGRSRAAQNRAEPGRRCADGLEHDALTDGHGAPLALSQTGGNRNDATQLMALLEAVWPVGGRLG